MDFSKWYDMKSRKPTGQDKYMSKRLSARRDAMTNARFAGGDGMRKRPTGYTMPGSMKRNGK